MQLQRFETINEQIRLRYLELKRRHPEQFLDRLNLSWSNWGFGAEPLADSAKRLQQAGIHYIELHGNHYGPSLGYDAKETLAVLGRHGIAVSGVCGMFSRDNDMSSNRPLHRQAAIDYIKRETEFTAATGGGYMLVVPGAVGRPKPYDDMEWERSVATLQSVADIFVEYGVKSAIEPIRSAEVSLVRTIADAKHYIAAVDHPGVQHINADVFHMQAEEKHIAAGLLEADGHLINLHMADSNRCALGDGSMDLDTIIMALYLLGFNKPGRFVTPEPLGPGGDPYPAMNGRPNKEKLDKLVTDSAHYFRERENQVLARQ